MKVTLPDGRTGDAAKCRSCDADIVWVESLKTGRKMPVNAGSVISHFATCPQAESWRK